MQAVFFLSAYDNTTDGIKQKFEQTYWMIYGSIKNVVAIGIQGEKQKIRSTKLHIFIKAI